MVRLTMIETTHLELIIVNLFTSIAEQVELQEQILIVDKRFTKLIKLIVRSAFLLIRYDYLIHYKQIGAY